MSVTVAEVFEDHRPLLMALMDKAPRGTADPSAFAPVLAVLDVYARQITELDKILHPVYVVTTVPRPELSDRPSTAPEEGTDDDHQRAEGAPEQPAEDGGAPVTTRAGAHRVRGFSR